MMECDPHRRKVKEKDREKRKADGVTSWQCYYKNVFHEAMLKHKSLKSTTASDTPSVSQKGNYLNINQNLLFLGNV